jgi:hypothetical protein
MSNRERQTDRRMRTERRTRSDRLRCLVVDSDRTKRAFLAEAWAYFHPGFDVVTAASTDAALEWIASTHLDVVAVGTSVGPDAVGAVINAMSHRSADSLWCLVIERHPDTGAWDLPAGAFRVLDLWDALSLEQVLRVGRTAADLVRTGPSDDDQPSMPRHHDLAHTPKTTPNGSAPAATVRT